jgi:hypothetical protein
MALMTKLLAGATAVLLLALVAGGVVLKHTLEETGALRQSLDQALADNKEWETAARLRGEFLDEVRKGFATLTRSAEERRQTQDVYQKQVRTNARANDALDPDERAALQLLGRPRAAEPAGAPAGGDPGKPPPVR